jgi:CRISPR-associated endonuclease/helicase Cas3
MEKYFPYEGSYMPTLDYADQSAKHAQGALEKLGWLGWQPSGEKPSFAEMFPSTPIPYVIQQKFFEATSDLSPPALVILEAPTGSGKTEASLYLADRWVQTSEGSGMYIAMPTQATSNQMFERFVNFLQTRYSDQWVNVHLVHGQARFSEKLQELELTEIATDRDRDENGNIGAMTWFLPRKRTLLAPFGVGTVDQALMSVLQTKHFFVRLFGLSRKVVIFDEVHAYDTYMSTLFQRLLGWLRAVGTSVIILTATLPEKTRQDLAAAYLGKRYMEVPAADYPRLTVATSEGAYSTPLPSPPECRLALEWIGWEAGEILGLLENELQDGGCAAVICNRVARAQEIYQAISEADIVEKENLILFHAQFPFVWRDGIERQVLGRFAKDGVRPHKAIVVATQVIEQSLDLDFDIIVTDLPPVDLLLQRAGRLHRHPKRDAGRPARLDHPRLAITSPRVTNGVPDFCGDEYVYDKYILLQTWRVLSDKFELITPSETSSLIESVYSDPHLAENIGTGLAEALEESWREMQDRNRGDIFTARTRLIRKPAYEDLLYQTNLGLDEEDPTIHQAFRAMTRLIEPGVTLVCLHDTVAGLALEPDGRGAPINLDTKPSTALVEELAKRTVTVRRWAVLNHFQSKEPPKAWSEVAALRYHHLAVFKDGICPLESTNIVLSLSRETGLRIVASDNRN